MFGSYELRLAKDGQKYFVLKAANGEVIVTSEMYKTTQSALKGIRSVRKNALFAPVKKLGATP